MPNTKGIRTRSDGVESRLNKLAARLGVAAAAAAVAVAVAAAAAAARRQEEEGRQAGREEIAEEE